MNYVSYDLNFLFTLVSIVEGRAQTFLVLHNSIQVVDFSSWHKHYYPDKKNFKSHLHNMRCYGASDRMTSITDIISNITEDINVDYPAWDSQYERFGELKLMVAMTKQKSHFGLVIRHVKC